MANKWRSINLLDVLGMATNPVKTSTKYAKRLLNVYTHEKPGALTLRPGYALKYTAPSENTIINSKFLNFAPFFDRQAKPEGQEIICLIQKGEVIALKQNDTPIVSNTVKGFWFWTRPYWNGSQWIDDWQWINKTIITKITDKDITYQSHIRIFGNLSHGLGDDSLIGWTIYNVNKNEIAKIITCKLESPWEPENNLRLNLWLNITLYDNNWEIGDVVIISRCWIDLEEQLELFNNVEKEDITFHRINNDLRIGFGGKKNRPGIAIGYRKFYYQISNINFPKIESDLQEEGVLEKFSKFDGIYLDKHILYTDEVYGLELETLSEGDLPSRIYYFRLTGQADYYTEQLVSENSIITEANQKIIALPFIKLGKDNIRLTGLKLYFSTDSINFYKTKTYSEIKKDSYNNITEWEIDRKGRLILKLNAGIELNDEASAVSTINEQHSYGNWTPYDLNGDFIIDNESAIENKQYSFKITTNAYNETVPQNLRRGIKLDLGNKLEKDKRYTVNCYLKMQNDDLFEDFEDTNYINGLTIAGFIRSFSEDYGNSYVLYGQAFTGEIFQPFPDYADYVKIENINNPLSIEFNLYGHVSIYKQIGTNNPIFIQDVISNDFQQKRIVNINEGNTTGVTIYILHDYDSIIASDDNPVIFYEWNECYLDNIHIKINSESRDIDAFICGQSLTLDGVMVKTISNATITYKKFTFDLFTGIEEEPKYLVFAVRPRQSYNTTFWIDEISIKPAEIGYFDRSDYENPGMEITDELGYKPTYNLVKGWDKVLLKDGRAYYLNPFVEKRYDNFILVSAIAPPSIYMYDIASFDNFREIEKYDSNETLDIELLPNKEILILKDSSITFLSDDGRVGIIREPIYGVDCISKTSVVNINGLIFWCGKEEIYVLNVGRSLVPEPMLKNTIRDLYLAIEDKKRIFGTRNRFNTYRIRINDPVQKTEYLLTENGWVEERKWHFPEIYRVGFNNKLYFLNKGNIYEEAVDFSLPIIPYGQEEEEDE